MTAFTGLMTVFIGLMTAFTGLMTALVSLVFELSPHEWIFLHVLGDGIGLQAADTESTR